MNDQYKNSYKATAKELVSLSVYNVGYQLCDAGYQWGPGIRDHYLIHYVISGKGTYEVNNETHFLSAEDAFLVYPNTEIIYRADAKTPWEYAWVGFTGSDNSAGNRFFTQTSMYSCSSQRRRSQTSASAYL